MKIIETQRQRGYKNVVSLGHFCGPAQELERIGFRSCSLPFDWLIVADLKVVLSLIETHFKHFLYEEDLVQEKDVNPKYYYDTFNRIHHYHDFNATDKLSSQLPAAKKKYLRRIERFYQIVSEPCLFIRYCTDKDEYNWICENQELVSNILKKYNTQNDIIYVCNENDGDERLSGVFYVQPDINDTVNRHILKSSKSLLHFITSFVKIGYSQRLHNYVRYYYSRYKKKMRKVMKKF